MCLGHLLQYAVRYSLPTVGGAAGVEWSVLMSWSTRELADLAGTTLNTVRYYHRIGLLSQPDRTSKGYKQYTVDHLVRLLQIRRMRDLGVTIERIGTLVDADQVTAETLRTVDSELASGIERLQRARAGIAAALAGAAVIDVPLGFELVARKLARSERALLLIYSQLYDDDALADLRSMLEEERDDASLEFESLSVDATEATRADLAARYAKTIARQIRRYPWLLQPSVHFKRNRRITEQAAAAAIAALHNSAQLDVMQRAGIMARGLTHELPRDE